MPSRASAIHWTALEDKALRALVQRAKEARPDHWREEMVRLLGNPESRQCLHPIRHMSTALRRWDNLCHRDQWSLSHWTPKENQLLQNAVASQLGSHFYPMIDLSLTADTPEDKDWGKILERKGDDAQKRCLALNSKELKDLDWNRVSEQVGIR